MVMYKIDRRGGGPKNRPLGSPAKFWRVKQKLHEQNWQGGGGGSINAFHADLNLAFKF